MRRGPDLVASAGALVALASLWLPWFTRTLVVQVAAPGLDGSLSGWEAMGGRSIALIVVAVVALLGAVRPVPAFALFLAGAVSLVAVMAAIVAELGTPASEVTATSPGAGLLLGVAGASAVLLAGLGRLLGDLRRRVNSARTS